MGKVTWAHHRAVSSSGKCGALTSKARWAHLETVVSSLAKYHELTRERWAHQESGKYLHTNVMRSPGSKYKIRWAHQGCRQSAVSPPGSYYKYAVCSQRFCHELTGAVYKVPWARLHMCWLLSQVLLWAHRHYWFFSVGSRLAPRRIYCEPTKG
jgi:hypothetical protein